MNILVRYEVYDDYESMQSFEVVLSNPTGFTLEEFRESVYTNIPSGEFFDPENIGLEGSPRRMANRIAEICETDRKPDDLTAQDFIDGMW